MGAIDVCGQAMDSKWNGSGTGMSKWEPNMKPERPTSVTKDEEKAHVFQSKHCVVGLDNGRRNLRASPDCETQLGLLAVVPPNTVQGLRFGVVAMCVHIICAYVYVMGLCGRGEGVGYLCG